MPAGGSAAAAAASCLTAILGPSGAVSDRIPAASDRVSAASRRVGDHVFFPLFPCCWPRCTFLCYLLRVKCLSHCLGQLDALASA